MDLLSGVSGVRTAVELTRVLRDAAKAGTIKPDEFAGRVGEIYDYIADAKDALIDAKDQVQELREELRRLKESTQERRTIQAELTPEDNAYFRIVDEKKSGPFCTACWDDGSKLVRLTHLGLVRKPSGWKHNYLCALHPKHDVPMSKDYSAG